MKFVQFREIISPANCEACERPIYLSSNDRKVFGGGLCAECLIKDWALDTLGEVPAEAFAR